MVKKDKGEYMKDIEHSNNYPHSLTLYFWTVAEAIMGIISIILLLSLLIGVIILFIIGLYRLRG